jgi:hypothetical protein
MLCACAGVIPFLAVFVAISNLLVCMSALDAERSAPSSELLQLLDINNVTQDLIPNKKSVVKLNVCIN